MSTYGERFIILRDAHDMTQKQVAQALGVSRSQYSNVENDNREPSDLLIKAAAQYFGVDEDWLRTGDGIPVIDTSAALQKTFASYFMEITKAFSPVYSAYGEIMPLFHNDDVMRIYNYIAYKLKRGGMTAKNISALSQTFDTAFPGYASVIRDLERQSEMVRRGIEANIAAQEVRKPVSGQAAAGKPLYNDLADEDSVPVPPKYCTDRYMVIQAKGDSMEPDIKDGGYVVVQRDTHPSNGELALVLVEGWAADEYTIKIFYDRTEQVELRSYNPEYMPLVFPASQILRAERVAHIING